jgi:YHS domain-containing protein
MKALFITLIYLSISVAVLRPASAQTETDIRKKQYNLDKGIALGGYDPVAYFTQHKAVPGQSGYCFVYQGVIYQFASKANQEMFQQEPAAYEPVYGGWCAYGTADGHKAPTDPQAWAVKDGKLYLNYSKQVQQTWKKDPQAYILKADHNWPQLKDHE